MTLRSNALVRVYETVPDTSEEGTLSRLWACHVGSTRRVELVDAYENAFGEEQAYSSVRLAGRRVAFVLTSATYEGEIRLKLKREVRRVDLARDHTDSAPVAGPVRLVMSRSGGVAWIEAGSVRALAPPGARTLDPGRATRDPSGAARSRRAGGRASPGSATARATALPSASRSPVGAGSKLTPLRGCRAKPWRLAL